VIEFDHVSASYGVQAPVINDVSFAIGDGEFVSFVGTNGAGKSTTMRLCNGLLKPTKGQVLLDGVPTTQLKTSQLARTVGFLFQNPDRQICCNTVRDELLFSFEAQGADKSAAQERVDAVIAEFGFDGQADPFLLNRGTRQLLALASVVVCEPKILILDEPTTGLDHRECLKVMDYVGRLNREKGTTVVMVCHDMEVIADYAKRVIVMTKGQVVGEGPTFEVLRNRSVVQEADLLAPQVVDISMRLIEECPELADGPIGCANTLAELEQAIEEYAPAADVHSRCPKKLDEPEQAIATAVGGHIGCANKLDEPEQAIEGYATAAGGQIERLTTEEAGCGRIVDEHEGRAEGEAR
jgi:energy-coupling factor transport system ATP-binding protein